MIRTAKSVVFAETEEMFQKDNCSPVLTKEGEITITTSFTEGKGHSSHKNDITMKRKSANYLSSKKSNATSDTTSDKLRRTKSEGNMKGSKTDLLSMGGSERHSRTSRQSSDSLQEVSDFPVKPYYTDNSDHTVSIPWRLRMKESKYTLRYRRNFKKEIEAQTSFNLSDVDEQEEEDAMKLERTFIKLRFTKSRRLVRICILFIILVPILGTVMDDCDVVENDLKISRSVCIENNADATQRRIVFMTILLPISLVWFACTFFKFYIEYLPWLPSFFILLCGGCSIATTFIGKVPDSGIYMGYLFAVWLFIRIPFYTGFVISWTTVLSYCASRLAIPKLADGPLTLKAAIDMGYLIFINIVLTCAVYIWERTDRKEFIESKVEAHVRANTQNILNQIIPPAIQKRIQSNTRSEMGELSMSNGRGVIADEESDVSVLFSDIKGFTKFCSGVRAMDVVKTLNTLYNRFDRKLEKLGVYKVETIGDAYFVSANCPIKANDHARLLVQLGREMIYTCTTFRPGGTNNEDYKFEMRIGVHSGKVCAGVVGYKMPRYHLFGQTVTIAECMESSGEPGKIQISEATKRYLEEWEEESEEKLDFICVSRGRREVIPDVSLETFFIEFTSQLTSSVSTRNI